jgi:hypothetical protein
MPVHAERLLRELISVAERLGVGVRVEPIRTRGVEGGLCRLRGKLLVVLNELSSPLDQLTSLADALLGFDVQSLDLSLDAAALLDDRRQRRPPKVARGPGLVGFDPREGRRGSK